MKKKVVFILAALMSCLLCACGTESNLPTQNSEIDMVELSSPQFWIDRLENPDVVMTREEIEEQNELLMSTWGTDWTFGYYDVKAFPETIEGEWLKKRICFPDLKNTKLFYKGEAISESQWDVYFANLNLESIPEEKKTLYAVINENASALDLPTEDIFTDSSMNEAFNALQQTAYKVNEPIVVLHESRDGKWVFVVANEYIGWVKKESCSFFRTRQEWLDYQEKENFIMITEDCNVAGIPFPLLMGTKLYLADGDGGESSLEYRIILPKRGEDGYVLYEEVLLPKSDAICEGYLPFTQDAVIRLAFQELGEPYGWGSADGKRDCSSYVKDIYACFGFQLPRNSRLQQTMPGIAKDIYSLSKDEKESYMEKLAPGDILGISGHIMIYLGEANGKHYIISMLSSYIPEEVTENFGNSIEAVNKVFVNSLNVKRKSGNTWLQELNGVVHFE